MFVLCRVTPADSHCYCQWLSVVIPPPGSKWGTELTRLTSRERTGEREVKRLKLTISRTDRESDFISTFTDNPLQEDTLCMDIYWGYHTNITIYNLYLSYTMIYCMNQQILLPITCFQILMKKNNKYNHLGIQVRPGQGETIGDRYKLMLC